MIDLKHTTGLIAQSVVTLSMISFLYSSNLYLGEVELLNNPFQYSQSIYFLVEKWLKLLNYCLLYSLDSGHRAKKY
jgi:hypothetical protein